MASLRLFARSALALIATAVAAKAGAVVLSKEASTPSVADRVAAIRAKASALPGAQSGEANAGRPAHVAWNDWKNE